MFLGDAVWSLVPFINSPPEFYKILKANAMHSLMVIFLILPTFVNSLATTGAFEVTLNGEQVIFSRIATGMFPNADDLITALTDAGLHLIQ